MEATETRALPVWVAALALGGLVLTGLYGAGFWLLRDRGPERAALAGPAAWLRARVGPEDTIILAPAYATRARELLGDLNPIAPRDPVQEDLSKSPQVFVFGLFGAAEALRPALAKKGLMLAETEAGEGVVVDRYENPAPERTRFSFDSALRQAKVSLVDGARKIDCKRWSAQGGGRWVCPRDGSWQYVGVEWHRVGDRLRRCLWAHPPKQGSLRIEYFDVPMSGLMVGWGGHTLIAARREVAPVELRVQLGQGPAQSYRFSGEEPRQFRLRTPTVGTATVSFSVSTEDNGSNHFCFEADLRSAP